MNRVQVGDYTCVSDTKDSETVLVQNRHQSRVLPRKEAEQLFLQFRAAGHKFHVHRAPFAKRERWAGTNQLRHK